jgi:very-short-patch-repair endonuclease
MIQETQTMVNNKKRRLTEEHKMKLSKSHMGHLVSDETKLKISLGNKRKHVSEQTKRKISMYHQGKKLNKETCIKISIAALGRKHTNKTKEKMRLSHLGSKNHFYGKTHSDIYLKKFRLARKNWITPKYDTSIEIKIQNYLTELGIEYYTHKYMNILHGYQCDIFIPILNLVIECDGNYWHSYPTGNDIDHIRTKELIEKGFKVLRLWEFDIKNMEIKEFEERLKNVK